MLTHTQALTAAEEHEVQVSDCGNTVWVHAHDGSTVGRFSKRFGMDVHNTISDQLMGQPQCLHCTHEKPNHSDWVTFCKLMQEHYGIAVDQTLLQI